MRENCTSGGRRSEAAIAARYADIEPHPGKPRNRCRPKPKQLLPLAYSTRPFHPVNHVHSVRARTPYEKLPRFRLAAVLCVAFWRAATCCRRRGCVDAAVVASFPSQVPRFNNAFLLLVTYLAKTVYEKARLSGVGQQFDRKVTSTDHAAVAA